MHQALAGEPEWTQLLPFLLPALIVVVILRRNLRSRPLKIERLWIYPVLILVAVGSLLVSQPPPLDPITLGLLTAALSLGAILGWQRGRFTHIEVHPETHELTSKSSPLGLVLILGLFLLRYGLRSVDVSRLHLPISPVALTDASLVLAMALMVAQRLEMWLRAQRLLADAIAAKAAGGTVPPIVS